MRLLLVLIMLISIGCDKINMNEPSAEANTTTNKIIIEDKDEVSPDVIDWIYNDSRLPKTTAEEISKFINDNCKYPHLIHGIIMRESNFNIFAHRKDTKVYGLGQITFEVWKEEIIQFDVLEARDLYDWKKNILVTNYIFNKYFEQTGDLRKALQKYVGQVDNDMHKYCSDILAHVGYLYIIEQNNS